MFFIFPLFTVSSLHTLHGLVTNLVLSRWLDIGKFFCVFMDQGGVEIHKHARKRTRSSHLGRTSLARFYCMEKRTLFSCGTQRVILSGIANDIVELSLSCPLTERAIV